MKLCAMSVKTRQLQKDGSMEACAFTELLAFEIMFMMYLST